MAPRGATASVFGLDEFQGETPLAERNAVLDQLRILAGMNYVTNPARLAAVFPVDMKVMQIPLPVAEACCEGCCGESEQVAVMATETKLIFIVIVGYIEVGRVRFDKELDIRRAMGTMARSALPFFDRAVDHGLRFFDEILMAVEAEVLAGFRQELGRIARMG